MMNLKKDMNELLLEQACSIEPQKRLDESEKMLIDTQKQMEQAKTSLLSMTKI